MVCHTNGLIRLVIRAIVSLWKPIALDSRRSTESFPGFAFKQGPEDCIRELQITFLTLETYHLGGDGHTDDRHGNVGPVYGYFYANERQISFSGGSLGSGLDMPNGFYHNRIYDLGEMAGDPAWRFSSSNHTLVDIPRRRQL